MKHSKKLKNWLDEVGNGWTRLDEKHPIQPRPTMVGWLNVCKSDIYLVVGQVGQKNDTLRK